MIDGVWARVALIGLVVAAFAALQVPVYNAGYNAAEKKALVREIAADKAAQTELDKERDKVRTVEARLDAKFDQAAKLYLEESGKYETQINALRVSARAGNIRLRVPASSCDRAPVPENSTAASASSGQEICNILPATAAEFISIAAGSAKDVRDYNSLVDLYNEVREEYNSLLK